MKELLFLVLGLGLIVWSFIYFWDKPAYRPVALSIGDTLVEIEIASTQTERNLGLSGRNSLEEGRGMLFVFPTPGDYGFWMKDMHFAIDIIWISADKEVLGIAHSVSPETYPETFFPPSEILYVLEVPAGFSERHGIEVGSDVSFQLTLTSQGF